MKVEDFVGLLDADFYSGVPDSLLAPLCNFLMDTFGTDPSHHVIAANEGNSVAIAAGYHLATGKVPVVYLQNSGEGNIINPAASLLNEKVYAIPCIFVVGWRGEPGVHDEPQHVFQGEITIKLLEDMGIKTFVAGKETRSEDVQQIMKDFRRELSSGKVVAFVMQKGALTYDRKVRFKNDYVITREEAVRCILRYTGNDPVISTTGKASRELFEIREAFGQEHGRDFLTVGSMGHSSSIALGIAIQKPNTRVWCIDGDGAALMHMGAFAVTGAASPDNLVHIVINNESHESVGGMPTASKSIDFPGIAKSCGYVYVVSVRSIVELEKELLKVKKQNSLSFIEVKCAIGARNDLGRPTTTPIENKICFMEHLKNNM